VLRRRPHTGSPEASEASAVILRRRTLILGLIELGAMAALATTFFEAPAGSRRTWLAAAAFICVAAMGGVWLTWIVPLNAALASDAASMHPSVTSHHERRRATLHGLRLILAILALALLVMALVAQPLQ
jgi:uncharacterized membrane protein